MAKDVIASVVASEASHVAKLAPDCRQAGAGRPASYAKAFRKDRPPKIAADSSDVTRRIRRSFVVNFTISLEIRKTT